MARSDEDIINVEFTLRGKLSLDIERIEGDPIWRIIRTTNESQDFNYLLNQYLEHYILRERLLRDMPSTNGPGSLELTEDISNGSN